MRNLALFLILLLCACEDSSQPLPDGGSVIDSGIAESGDSGDSGDSGEAVDSGACPSNGGCAEVDATRCGPGGFERCSEVSGCLVWTAEACAGACVEDRCHECAGGPGTFAEQTIEVDGETRYYFLHVPTSYTCEAGAPLWVDFHGTASDRPEEAYKTPELVEVSDREGAVVVRPRSRSSGTELGQIYRWDQNPGDLARNIRFTNALIETLGDLYHLDRERRYASGFSSGANMAAQFIGSGHTEFKGVAMVGGGYWADPQIGDLSGSELRVYAVTGYRDYLIGTLLPFLPELEDHGLPSENLFFRETDSGHELYGWELEEIFAWLDRGERPANGGLTAGWSLDPSLDTTDTLIQLEITRAGDLLATSDRGMIHRFSNGGWSNVPLAAGPLTGLCILPSGRGMAVGAHAIGLTDDFGATWTAAPPAPELSGQYFGAAYLNDVACFGTDSIVAAGYWSGVRSDDRAASYRAAELTLGGIDVPAQVSAVEVTTSSTAVATGYFYLGRSDDAEHFASISFPPDIEWLNDVASAPNGRWFVVGEAGVIARSDDNGFTWDLLTTNTTEDLYAIDFFDQNVGLAVGLHGAALYTEDGGDTWRDVSTGLDRFLGGVRWLDSANAIVVGERGTVLYFAP